MTNISLNYTQLFSTYLVFNYLPNILSLCLFLLQFIDIRYYIIYAEKEKFRQIVKKISEETYFGSYKYNNGRTFPSGFFVSWYCIGHFNTMDKYEDGETIQILCSTSFFNKITMEPRIESAFTKSSTTESSVSKSIRVYNRYGTYKRFYYDYINLDLSTVEPLGKQAEIVEDISTIFNKNKRATVFINGVSYAGKSSIGYLLAKKYNGRFCHSFNPTDPGDQIAHLISIMNDGDSDVPIIIVLEEVDVMINGIHTNSVKFNADIPTAVYNKSTWSNFLDDMIFYKNVILVLTSNTSKDKIDLLDQAYLRKGRINEYYTMNHSLGEF